MLDDRSPIIIGVVNQTANPVIRIGKIETSLFALAHLTPGSRGTRDDPAALPRDCGPRSRNAAWSDVGAIRGSANFWRSGALRDPPVVKIW